MVEPPLLVLLLLLLLVVDDGVRALCVHGQVEVRPSTSGPPRQEISVEDVTAQVQDFVTDSKLREGTVTLYSRHTTTALTINEFETRLVDDLRHWLLGLAPPDARSEAATKGASYRHNDLDQRPDGPAERRRCLDNGWNVDDPDELQKWRDQEPINAHSHLLAMLLGATLSLGVSDGKILLGSWQSILLVDLDGPRDRSIGITALGE